MQEHRSIVALLKERIPHNLKVLIDREHEGNMSALARAMMVDKCALRSWLNGQTTPSASALYRMHKYASIDINQLLAEDFES